MQHRANGTREGEKGEREKGERENKGMWCFMSPCFFVVSLCPLITGKNTQRNREKGQQQVKGETRKRLLCSCLLQANPRQCTIVVVYIACRNSSSLQHQRKRVFVWSHPGAKGVVVGARENMRVWNWERAILCGGGKNPQPEQKVKTDKALFILFIIPFFGRPSLIFSHSFPLILRIASHRISHACHLAPPPTQSPKRPTLIFLLFFLLTSTFYFLHPGNQICSPRGHESSIMAADWREKKNRVVEEGV